MRSDALHILWDWNGTLLDDAVWNFTVINRMLARRGLPVLADLDAYRAGFTFPIIDCYRALGFDFSREPYTALAAEYIEAYYAEDAAHCRVFPGADAVLRGFAAAGAQQGILSASAQVYLDAQVDLYGLRGHFHTICGIRDILAAGKQDIACAYRTKYPDARIVLIGDTVHDWAVAQAAGMDSVLVASGHQSRAALDACGAPVAERIDALPALFEPYLI